MHRKWILVENLDNNTTTNNTGIHTHRPRVAHTPRREPQRAAAEKLHSRVHRHVSICSPLSNLSNFGQKVGTTPVAPDRARCEKRDTKKGTQRTKPHVDTSGTKLD